MLSHAKIGHTLKLRWFFSLKDWVFQPLKFSTGFRSSDQYQATMSIAWWWFFSANATSILPVFVEHRTCLLFLYACMVWDWWMYPLTYYGNHEIKHGSKLCQCWALPSRPTCLLARLRELAEIALSYDRCSFVDELKSSRKAKCFDMNPKGFIVC